VISAVASAFPAPYYMVRTPAAAQGSAYRRFGMIAAREDLKCHLDEKTSFPWYGPAFD